MYIKGPNTSGLSKSLMKLEKQNNKLQPISMKKEGAERSIQSIRCLIFPGQRNPVLIRRVLLVLNQNHCFIRTERTDMSCH